MADDIAIGIDLGGTYVRVGAVNQEGELITVHQSPIEPEKGSKAGLILICSTVENVISSVMDFKYIRYRYWSHRSD